jgi:2-polyprenyl-3-methyl-5-hydroxy-6-metoxy-1,4-benzoquinol methylase
MMEPSESHLMPQQDQLPPEVDGKQQDISSRNSDFWNELCGSQLAKFLGITDSSPESLKKFDDWYFDFYPYLFEHIPFAALEGRDVLEVGLGYGTVSQRLAQAGARYTGLDIAKGPVQLVNQRLAQQGLAGEARQGSILAPPFAPASFDSIVAIGCLHHTGNLAQAIHQCWDLLRPGGTLVFMVYYAYSYRRWRMAPGTTSRHLARELLGYRGVVGTSADRERAAYDASAAGEAAPHTDWISAMSLRHLCGRFSGFSAKTENIDQEPPFSRRTRTSLLATRWPSLLGLDLYATARK